VAKDRAAPFSRKHRKYWLTITGGMVLIGLIDLVLGFTFWPHRPDEGNGNEHVPIKYNVKQVERPGAPRDAGAPVVAPATSTPR
jgi:hypothetical protein